MLSRGSQRLIHKRSCALPATVSFVSVLLNSGQLTMQRSVVSLKGRRPSLEVFCGDKSPAKAVRKRLERKRMDVEDATATLRSLPASSSISTVSAIVSQLQRLGCETELLLAQADTCLQDMADEAAAEQRKAEASAIESAADQPEETITATPSASVMDAKAITEVQEQPESNGNGSTHPLEASQAGSADRLASNAGQPLSSTSEAENGVASVLPDSDRLWLEARNALGEEPKAKITVCEGKSCCRAGGSEVMEIVKSASTGNPGLILGTSKCLDKCKQGPALRVETSNGTNVTCVSKDKPPKKPKKEKFGNNIVSSEGLSANANSIV